MTTKLVALRWSRGWMRSQMACDQQHIQQLEIMKSTLEQDNASHAAMQKIVAEKDELTNAVLRERQRPDEMSRATPRCRRRRQE